VIALTHEARFTGPDNAGLRASIRKIVASYDRGSGTSRPDAIRSLAGTVALSASGRATLDLVAADYGDAPGVVAVEVTCTTMTSKTASAAVFASLWTDAKYLRLQARKDAAIRAVVRAMNYRVAAADLAKLDAAAKRAVRAIQRYEDAALSAA